MSDLILAVALIAFVVVAAVVIERNGKKARNEKAQRELERFWRRQR